LASPPGGSCFSRQGSGYGEERWARDIGMALAGIGMGDNGLELVLLPASNLLVAYTLVGLLIDFDNLRPDGAELERLHSRRRAANGRDLSDEVDRILLFPEADL
jgi:hypothetical protein